MGCFNSKRVKHPPGYEDPVRLSTETIFNVSEVEALFELFKKLSSSELNDGRIHKEKFMQALFKSSGPGELLQERLFDLFDMKQNGLLDFGEFVRVLSVFHPNAPTEEKREFAFKLYDLHKTGFIDRDELREMLVAAMSESHLKLADDTMEIILDKTFDEADTKHDGKIDREEWKEVTVKHPKLLENMTLPILRDVTTAFPDFVFNSVVED